MGISHILLKKSQYLHLIASIKSLFSYLLFPILSFLYKNTRNGSSPLRVLTANSALRCGTFCRRCVRFRHVQCAAQFQQSRVERGHINRLITLRLCNFQTADVVVHIIIDRTVAGILIIRQQFFFSQICIAVALGKSSQVFFGGFQLAPSASSFWHKFA